MKEFLLVHIPTFSVISKSHISFFSGDNQPIFSFKAEANHIQIVVQYKSFARQNQALTHRQVLKISHHRHRALLAGLLEVLTNTDPKQNLLLTQIKDVKQGDERFPKERIK